MIDLPPPPRAAVTPVSPEFTKAVIGPRRAFAGGRVGEIGQTGNARSTPCHLHFEMHGPSGPFDPLPSLRAWDAYS